MEDYNDDYYSEPVKPEKKKTKDELVAELEKTNFEIEDASYVDEEFFSRTYETNWLIPNLIERNKVCILYGEKGTCKSFVALRIAWSLYLNKQILGSNIDDKGFMFVRYLALEDPEQHNVRLQALKSVIPLCVTDNVFQLDRKRFRLDGALENIAKIEVLTQCSDLLIIDTVSYMYPDGDETKGNIARLVMHELARCAEQNECTIIALHHPPDGNPNKLRGSSEMANSVNTIIQNKKGKLKVTKQRNGKTGKVVTYKMVPTLNSFTVEFTNSRKDLNQYEKTILEIVESADGQRISDKELIAQFKERYPDIKSFYSVLDRARKRNITLGFLNCDEKDKKITYEMNE